MKLFKLVVINTYEFFVFIISAENANKALEIFKSDTEYLISNNIPEKDSFEPNGNKLECLRYLKENGYPELTEEDFIELDLSKGITLGLYHGM